MKVIENQVPLQKGYRKEEYFDQGSGETVVKLIDKKGKRHPFPRLGAMEVYFQTLTVYSKMKTKVWPAPELVAKKLAKVVQNSRNGLPLKDGVDI